MQIACVRYRENILPQPIKWCGGIKKTGCSNVVRVFSSVQRTLTLKNEVGKMKARTEILDSLISDDDTEVVEQEKQVDNLNDENDMPNISLNSLLRLKAEETTDESLKKLLKSSCINFSNGEERDRFIHILPSNIAEILTTKCQEKRKEFESSLPPNMELMIDTVFDEMKFFMFE